MYFWRKVHFKNNKDERKNGQVNDLLEGYIFQRAALHYCVN